MYTNDDTERDIHLHTTASAITRKCKCASDRVIKLFLLPHRTRRCCIVSSFHTSIYTVGRCNCSSQTSPPRVMLHRLLPAFRLRPASSLAAAAGLGAVVASSGVAACMRIEEDVKLDYKDVLLRPKRSTLKSRSEVCLLCWHLPECISPPPAHRTAPNLPQHISGGPEPHLSLPSLEA